MKSASGALRRSIYSVLDGQLYDPDQIKQLNARSGVDWMSLERDTVARFNHDLAEIMSVAESAALKDVKYMTAGSNVINAIILRADRDVVIVFNIAIYSLLARYIQWFIVAYEAIAARDNATAQIACSKLIQIVELGTTGYTPTLIPHSPDFHVFDEPERVPWEKETVDGCVYIAQLFIMAHEIGHFVLGHLDVPKNWVQVRSRFNIQRWNESQRLEFEADAFAFDLLLRFPDLDEGSVALAVLPVFSMFAMSESIMRTLTDESVPPADSPPTHPNAANRAEMVRDRIGREHAWFDPLWQVALRIAETGLAISRNVRDTSTNQ